METKIYRITCLTNMHVGNGDVNYNIIDNEVEKDSITGYPMINASGLKGALRSHFEKNKNIDQDIVNKIFGKDSVGLLRFSDAYMLAKPCRASKGDKAYYMTTTETAIEKYNEFADLAGIGKVKVDQCNEDVRIENYKPTHKTKYDNFDLYVLSDRSFDKIALPVVARNKLDNGESKNLWYEEVVSHETVLYYALFYSECDKEFVDKFESTINNKYIQIGGNATIGCGICKIEAIGA